MKDFLKRIKLNEGNISLGMGILVMVVAGFLLFNYFKNINTISSRESRIMSAATEIVPTPSDSPVPTPSGKAAVVPTKIAPTKVAASPTKTVTSPTPTKAPAIILTSTPTPQPQPTVQPSVEASSGREYVVKSGDSLWKIAQATYSSGYDWSKIYEANKAAIGKNPSKLAVGTKLQLPTLSVAPTTATEYTVKSGDNLWNISVHICGSGGAYSAIAAANSIPNPRVIRPGLRLTVTCPQMR